MLQDSQQQKTYNPSRNNSYKNVASKSGILTLRVRIHNYLEIQTKSPVMHNNKKFITFDLKIFFCKKLIMNEDLRLFRPLRGGKNVNLDFCDHVKSITHQSHTPQNPHN